MAINWLETDVRYGSSPSFQRCIGYEEIGRDGSGVTFRIYLKLKVAGSSSSYYGYGINWRVDGGSWLKVKDASPRWYGNEGYREYTTTIYRSVGASGGSSSFSVQVDGLGGSCDYTSNYTANYSTFNTPPFWVSDAYFGVKEWNSNGAMIADHHGSTGWNFKAREDVDRYYLYWAGASDRDNNIVRYEVYCSENEGAYTRIYSGSDTNYTHYVGGGGSTQGRKYRWFVRAIDAYGMASPDMYVNQIEKNSLTGARLQISNALDFNSTKTTLTWSGASNTNTNGDFSYRIVSPHIKIYNIEKLNTSNKDILILKSGTSTEPYILFSELIEMSRNYGFNTYFDLQLITRNAYGSEASSSYRCNVDLRTDPQAPTTISIGGKTSTSLGAYLIPSKNKPTVTWSGASDKLGGSLTYEVYWKIGSGGETLINAGTNTSITLPISNVTASATLGVRVVAKTSYGRSSSASNNAETLHYYNPPSLYMTNPNRTITSFTVDIVSQLNTSIPNVKFSKQRYTGNGVTKDFTGLKYTATLTGLLENSTFDFTAIVNDNTGLSTDQSSVFKVVPAIPKLSVREGGVGINCVGSSDATLAVGGTIKATGQIYSNGKPVLTSIPALDNLSINTGVTSSTKGITVTNNAGITSKMWVGTGGAVLQSVGSATLHLGQNNSNDMVFYPDRIQLDKILKGGCLKGGNLTMQGNDFLMNNKRALVGWAGENDPLIINFDGDFKAGTLVHGYMNATGQLECSSMPPKWGSMLKVKTNPDGNGYGDGDTHIGYNGGDGYSHYFRGTGTFSVSCNKGVFLSNTEAPRLWAKDLLWVGDYKDVWQPIQLYRKVLGENLVCKVGSHSVEVRLTSNSPVQGLGAVRVEVNNDQNVLHNGIDITKQSVQPVYDNTSYLGTSMHRFSAIYATTGTVYSSSENEKKDIVPIEESVGSNTWNTRSTSTVTPPTQSEIIVKGIKNMNLYSYQYKVLDKPIIEEEIKTTSATTLEEPIQDRYVGFLGQELEEQDPAFFELVGSSRSLEDGTKQYDIREASINGVLFAGLKEALLKIEALENELNEMKIQPLKGGDL